MIILLSDNYWAIIEWIGVSKTKKIDKQSTYSFNFI
jgi:hypothetical protein